MSLDASDIAVNEFLTTLGFDAASVSAAMRRQAAAFVSEHGPSSASAVQKYVSIIESGEDDPMYPRYTIPRVTGNASRGRVNLSMQGVLEYEKAAILTYRRAHQALLESCSFLRSDGVTLQLTLWDRAAVEAARGRWAKVDPLPPTIPPSGPSADLFSDPDGLVRLAPAQTALLSGWRRLSELSPPGGWRMFPPGSGGPPQRSLSCSDAGAASDRLDATPCDEDIVLQGPIGCCSFLCALLVAQNYVWRRQTGQVNSTLQMLEDAIVPCRANPQGWYAVKLWVNGCWRCVEVDDRVPVATDGTWLVSRCAAGSLFVTLFEKAYMKATGGYRDGTSGGTDMLTLLGWAPSVTELPGCSPGAVALLNSLAMGRTTPALVLAEEQTNAGATARASRPQSTMVSKALMTASKLWRSLYRAWLAGKCLVTLATGAEAVHPLLPSHGYALCDMFECAGRRAVRLKNPWGLRKPCSSEATVHDRVAPIKPLTASDIRMEGHIAAHADGKCVIASKLTLNPSIPDKGIDWYLWEDVTVHFSYLYVAHTPECSRLRSIIHGYVSPSVYPDPSLSFSRRTITNPSDDQNCVVANMAKGNSVLLNPSHYLAYPQYHVRVRASRTQSFIRFVLCRSVNDAREDPRVSGTGSSNLLALCIHDCAAPTSPSHTPERSDGPTPQRSDIMHKDPDYFAGLRWPPLVPLSPTCANAPMRIVDPLHQPVALSAAKFSSGMWIERSLQCSVGQQDFVLVVVASDPGLTLPFALLAFTDANALEICELAEFPPANWIHWQGSVRAEPIVTPHLLPDGSTGGNEHVPTAGRVFSVCFLTSQWRTDSRSNSSHSFLASEGDLHMQCVLTLPGDPHLRRRITVGCFADAALQHLLARPPAEAPWHRGVAHCTLRRQIQLNKTRYRVFVAVFAVGIKDDDFTQAVLRPDLRICSAWPFTVVQELPVSTPPVWPPLPMPDPADS